MKVYQGRREKKIIEKVAQLMYTSYSMNHKDVFVIEPIYANRFKTIDLKFINSVTANLTYLNFCQLGDYIESSTEINPKKLPNFIRILVHQDGNIKACIFHLKNNAISHKEIEFATEFIGGPIFVTSNSTLYAKIYYPEAIQFEYQNAHTVPDLLNYHKNRIEQFQVASSKEIEKIHTEEDYQKQQARIKLIEKQFRASMEKEEIVEELRRLFFKIKKEQVLQKIADRIIELRSLPCN